MPPSLLRTPRRPTVGRCHSTSHWPSSHHTPRPEADLVGWEGSQGWPDPITVYHPERSTAPTPEPMAAPVSKDEGEWPLGRQPTGPAMGNMKPPPQNK